MYRRWDDTIKGYIRAHLPWFVSGIFFLLCSAAWGWAALKVASPITIYLRNESDHKAFVTHFSEDEKHFGIVDKRLDNDEGRLDRDHQEIAEMRNCFFQIMAELRKK
jgi:hypothetical protein